MTPIRLHSLVEALKTSKQLKKILHLNLTLNIHEISIRDLKVFMSVAWPGLTSFSVYDS